MNVTRSSMDEDPPSWPRTPVDFESLNPHHSETRHEQTTETLNYDRVQSETTYRVDYIKKSGVISPPRERPVLSPSPPLHSETTYKKEYCPKTYTLSPSKERPVLPTSPPLDAATSYRTEFSEKPFVASPRKSKPVIATGPPLEGSTSYRTEYTEKPSIISPRRERPILAASNPASSETEYRVQYVNKSPNRSHATVTSMDVPQSIPPEYDLHTQANQDILNVTSSITPTVSTNTSTYKFDYTEKSLVDNYSLPRYIIPTSPKSNSTNATNSGLKTTVDSPPLQQNLPTTLETPITPSKPVSTETAQETNRPTTTTMDTEPTHSLPEKYHGPTDHGLTSPLNSSYQQHFSNPSPETQAAIERRDWTSYYQNNKYHGPTDHNMEASTSSSYRSDYTAPQVASVIGSPRCKSPTLPRYKSPTDHGHVANTKTTYSEHFTPPKSSKNEESVESLAVIEPVVESPAPVEVAVDEASLGIAKRLYQSAADLVAAGRRYFTQYADPPPQHPTKINKSNRSSISASSSVEKPTKQNTTTGRVPRTSSIETMTTYRRDFSPPPSHIKPTASELQPQRLQVTSPPRARSTTENKPVRIKPEDLPPAGKPRYNIQPRFTSPVRPVHEATNRNDITPKKPTQDS